MAEPQKTRLIVEAELPSFYCDDLADLCAEYSWPTFDATQPTEDLLREIGEVRSGLLTVEISGEKDSDVAENLPILFRKAWVEQEPPSDVPDWGVIERVRETEETLAYEGAYERAHTKTLLASLRERLPEEWQALDSAAIDAGIAAGDAAVARIRAAASVEHFTGAAHERPQDDRRPQDAPTERTA